MAKRLSNDGKSFENLVRMIQEAYRDSPDTEILSDVKLPDKMGGKGQIDILIVIKSNGFKLTIAIECKDYNKPISKEKIDAFYAKCDMIEEIDKLVFVSKSGYQSGAISAAKYRGIELYNIEDVTTDLLNHWKDLDNFMQISIESAKDITYVVTFTNGKTWSGANIPPTTVIISESGLSAFNAYIKQCINTLMVNYALPAVTNVLLNNFEFYISNESDTFEEKIQFRTDFTNSFRLGFNNNNQKFHTHTVSYIVFSIQVIFKLHHSTDISGKKYKGVVRATHEADILQVKLNNYDLNVIETENTDEAKYFKTDDTGIIEELRVLHKAFIPNRNSNN